MTVNCLNDESYTDASAGGHQVCYCIHIDSVFAASERYFTTVRNCKLFSTCHSPVGAGLADNQTIRLDGCECVSDTHVGTSTGAATSSSEFHALHTRHCPRHSGDFAPHSAHTYVSLILLAMKKPSEEWEDEYSL